MTKELISKTAKIYSKALIDSARETNSIEEIKKELKDIIETIKSSDDLNIVLENPSINANNKSEILNDIFSGKIDQKLLNFLQILIQKQRFSELNDIYLAFCEMTDDLSNTIRVTVISSVDLTPQQQDKIIKKLKDKLKTEIVPKWEKDENIIAGLVFKFGDYVIDSSIRAKLENLSKNILR